MAVFTPSMVSGEANDNPLACLRILARNARLQVLDRRVVETGMNRARGRWLVFPLSSSIQRVVTHGWLPGHLRQRRIVSPVQSFVSVEPIEDLNAWESRCLTVFQIRVEPSIVSAEHPGLWSGFRP